MIIVELWRRLVDGQLTLFTKTVRLISLYVSLLWQPNKKIYESFGIFCPKSRLECIDQLQGEDVLIDWTEPLYLNFTHVAIMERIEDFYHENIGNVDKLIGDIYVCNREEPPGDDNNNNNNSTSDNNNDDNTNTDNTNSQLPTDYPSSNDNDDDRIVLLPEGDVEMRPLVLENVKAIHDLYPASEIECLEVFEKLVTKLPGFGIFSVETGDLAAWMIQSYYGAMCSMQTRPEYRRKGYGMHLARALTGLVLKRGYQPFVVIRPENDASKSLYIKLGFEKAFSTIRAILKPYPEAIDGTEVRENGGDHLEEIDVEVYREDLPPPPPPPDADITATTGAATTNSRDNSE